MRDFISVTNLTLSSTALEFDLWQRQPNSQPLLVDLLINSNVSDEAQIDNLTSHSLNYGSVTKLITAAVANLELSSLYTSDYPKGIPLEIVAELLAKVIIFKAHAPNVSLQVARPRAILSAESVAVHLYRERADYSSAILDGQEVFDLLPTSKNAAKDKLVVKSLSRSIIIGLNPAEREDEQEVILDLEFGAPALEMAYTGGVRVGWRDWRRVVKDLEAHLSYSKPLTIEAITTSLSKIIVTPPPTNSNPSYSPTWNVPLTTVRLSKPSALVFAKYPSVQITRSRTDFFPPSSRPFSSSSTTSLGKRIAVIAVGSNIGERVGHISKALKELGKAEDTKVVDTSFLYESEAMYVEDQDKFLNGVVKIETTLDPIPLIHRLKEIEKLVGREKTFRNGPRVVDLDILFYENLVLDTTKDSTPTEDELWLKIPHERIQEREFVLRPLADLAPDFVHPVLHQTPTTLLSTLLLTTPSTLHRVLPLSSTFVHPTFLPPSSSTPRKTLVMSILNTTPDSFSDGGDHYSLSSALTSAQEHAELGVDIIDIGGMSTRPGAEEVSEEEEFRRVVPLIKAIRESSSESLKTVPISVDTFRPSVARAAVEAGATIINDVLGGSSPGMLETMAELHVPVVLMHSRGDSKTMGDLTEYENGDVVGGVRNELSDRVKDALEKGVWKWNIVLDPGIGFAKKGGQNVELMRRLPEVLGRTSSSGVNVDDAFLAKFPSLIGLSRKRFLGTLISSSSSSNQDNPKDRDYATAAGVAASVAGGADIVRVHNVKMGLDVVRVSDAIWDGE